MAFNGSGVFNLVSGNPVVTGTTISSTWANNTLSDVATGLSNCVTRDGQSPATANLPMGGYKLTGLALATATGDALSYGRAATVTDLTSSGTLTLSGGTANGVAYQNASKQVTSGSALTFDGTNLGIGVAVPGQIIDASAVNPRLKLTATSTGYAASQFVNSSGSSYFGRDNSTGGFFGIANGTIVYSSTNDPIGFYLSGSEQMRLTSTGLGIGTSSPNEKLVVNGAVRAISNANNWTASAGAIMDWYGAGSLARFIASDGTNSGSMFLSSSGNLGLGVTPSAWSGTNTKSLDISLWTSLANGNAFGSALTFNGYYNGTNWIYKQNNSASKYESDGQHRWYTAPSGTAGTAISFTQAMTLDASGNLLVGSTSNGAANAKFCVTGATGQEVVISAVSGTCIKFTNSQALGGSISVASGGGTTYATSSDYRLKENIAPMMGALAKVAALNPVTYTWKADGSNGQGFIAHELQAVVPDCVTGEKDAVDAKGNPVYQGIDTSFLVATLTKAIQEQQAIIESLIARITILEAK